MNPSTRAADPISAFQSALEKLGYEPEEILKRTHIVRCILGAMRQDDTSNQAYRQAVDATLITMPNRDAGELCRRVSREFFPFFVDAGRQVPVEPRTASVPLEQIVVELPAHEGLDDLIRHALAMKPSPEEARALEAFSAFLKTEKLEKRSREKRTALAQLLLLGMRPLKRDGRHYRALIEGLLPLFTRDETRSYFLGVAREFHPYIIGSHAELARDRT